MKKIIIRILKIIATIFFYGVWNIGVVLATFYFWLLMAFVIMLRENMTVKEVCVEFLWKYVIKMGIILGGEKLFPDDN